MRVVKGSGDGVRWIETILTDTIPMTKEQRISRWKSSRRKYVIRLLDRSNPRNDQASKKDS